MAGSSCCSFGYTYCPDVCPTTLAELKVVMEKLNGQADKVQVVFVSVDPGRDTSEEMQKYIERFSPSFIGLSGSEEELAPIWDDYGVFREVVERTSETNYIINHTARVTLIDQNGNMRLSYGFQTPPEDIAHDIEILLNQ
ncbi:SCO family protein [Candidatus Villigracilis affinis]|uniref:SCO family protein n=1 Tax=Candidatus Villigracilis affinis TaxID=3140682 RepID=UPI001DF1A8A8|nr:SCO family protein [Anaerolineales bacterium]